MFTTVEDGAIGPLDGADICNAIAGLANPYMAQQGGNGIVCELIGDHRDRLVMKRVRWTDHPGTWRRDGVSGVLNLDADVALTEPTHVRFFPGNIVAIDVNRSGPWPTALRDYLQDRLPNTYGNFQMLQVLDRTAQERLARITRVNSVELRLSGPTLARLPQGPHNFMDPIRGMVQFGNAGVLQLAWKRWKGIRVDTEALKAMVTYFIEHANDLDEKAQIIVSGSNQQGSREMFSLRRDYVTAHVEIHRTDDRRIDSTDAFEQLRHAYNSVTEQFPPQVFIGPPPN